MPSALPVELSIIVPAYNEERRLAAPLREIGRYLEQSQLRSEIVVVDDGSIDRTFELACEIGADLPVPVRVVRSARNRGKGHALKLGFEVAEGERLLFTDADLSTPIAHADDLLAALDRGFDVVIGSRKMPGAELEVHQPFLRETLGKGFTLLVRILIGWVSDVTCGFKMFRAEVGKDLFGRVRVFDWSYDAEVIFLVGQQGLRLTDVPVRWHDESGTKVRLVDAVLRSLIGLLRIRWYAARGVYATTLAAEEPAEIRTFRPAPAVSSTREPN